DLGAAGVAVARVVPDDVGAVVGPDRDVRDARRAGSVAGEIEIGRPGAAVVERARIVDVGLESGEAKPGEVNDAVARGDGRARRVLELRVGGERHLGIEGLAAVA